MTKKILSRTQIAGLVAQRILKGCVDDAELASLFTEYCSEGEEIVSLNPDGSFVLEKKTPLVEGWVEQQSFSLADSTHKLVTEYGGTVMIAWYQGEEEAQGQLKKGARFVIISDNGGSYKVGTQYMVWDYTYDPDIDYSNNDECCPRYLRGVAVFSWSEAHAKAREMMENPPIENYNTQ